MPPDPPRAGCLSSAITSRRAQQRGTRCPDGWGPCLVESGRRLGSVPTSAKVALRALAPCLCPVSLTLHHRPRPRHPSGWRRDPATHRRPLCLQNKHCLLEAGIDQVQHLPHRAPHPGVREEHQEVQVRLRDPRALKHPSFSLPPLKPLGFPPRTAGCVSPTPTATPLVPLVNPY